MTGLLLICRPNENRQAQKWNGRQGAADFAQHCDVALECHAFQNRGCGRFPAHTKGQVACIPRDILVDDLVCANHPDQEGFASGERPVALGHNARMPKGARQHVAQT